MYVRKTGTKMGYAVPWLNLPRNHLLKLPQTLSLSKE